MSQDYSVYARRDQVPVRDLIAALAERGMPLEWREDPFFPTEEGEPWQAAYVAPEGAPESGREEIGVESRPVTDVTREDVLDAYRDALDDAGRAIVEVAPYRYRISAPADLDESRARLLTALIDGIAELGDGVIIDQQTNETYDRAAWRARWPELLG